jgi:hypothetical protein
MLLKDKPVDPSADNNCALRMAIQLECPKLVWMLFRDGRIDPGSKEQYNLDNSILTTWIIGSLRKVEIVLEIRVATL